MFFGVYSNYLKISFNFFEFIYLFILKSCVVAKNFIPLSNKKINIEIRRGGFDLKLQDLNYLNSSIFYFNIGNI